MYRWIPILLLLALAACERSNTIRIDGELEGLPKGKPVFLDELLVESSILIDSCVADEKGRIQFRIRGKELPEFYRLRLTDNNRLTLLAGPGEKISFSGSLNDSKLQYTLAGSEGSSLVQSLEDELGKNVESLDSIAEAYFRLPVEPQTNETRAELEANYLALVKAQKKYTIGFVITHYKSLASIFALYQKLNDTTWVLDSPREIQYFKIVSDSLGKVYPQSKYVKALKADLNRQLAGYRNSVLEHMASKAPVGYPDLNLENRKGESINLRTLAGNVILLNFWTSSSSSSLMLNRSLMDLYTRYKSRGFTVYSVSLDTDRERWEQSLDANEYPWINVIDRPSGSSKASVMYNVKQVPTTFLISRSGDIVARDLNETELLKKVAELTSK